jgi:outer membrane protein
MKKSLLGCAILAATFVSSVQADTLLGAYVGAQGWNMAVDGGFSNEEQITNFSFDEQTNESFYVALEHPVPFLPNIKISRTILDTAGVTTLETSFEFDGELYSENTDLVTDFEMTGTDFILYYEILDNDLVSIDLGINGKYIDGIIMVQESDGNRRVFRCYSNGLCESTVRPSTDWFRLTCRRIFFSHR